MSKQKEQGQELWSAIVKLVEEHEARWTAEAGFRMAPLDRASGNFMESRDTPAGADDPGFGIVVWSTRPEGGNDLYQLFAGDLRLALKRIQSAQANAVKVLVQHGVMAPAITPKKGAGTA